MLIKIKKKHGTHRQIVALTKVITKIVTLYRFIIESQCVPRINDFE